jgi:hypothetical protein
MKEQINWKTNAEDLNKKTQDAQSKLRVGGDEAFSGHFELNKIQEEVKEGDIKLQAAMENIDHEFQAIREKPSKQIIKDFNEAKNKFFEKIEREMKSEKLNLDKIKFSLNTESEYEGGVRYVYGPHLEYYLNKHYKRNISLPNVGKEFDKVGRELFGNEKYFESRLSDFFKKYGGEKYGGLEDIKYSSVKTIILHLLDNFFKTMWIESKGGPDLIDQDDDENEE